MSRRKKGSSDDDNTGDFAPKEDSSSSSDDSDSDPSSFGPLEDSSDEAYESRPKSKKAAPAPRAPRKPPAPRKRKPKTSSELEFTGRSQRRKMASPGPLPNPYRNPPPNPDRLAEQRSRPTPARRNSKSRKRIEVPLDYGRPLAEYPPEELETDPAGRKCRFVPFNQVKDNLLDPTSYLGPGEEGVMTFLPGYCPTKDNHLSYFGYESQLAVTELSKIQAMSDADLRAELEQIEEELQRIPKSHAKPTVAVPGFSTKLTDSIAINADVTKFDWKRLGRLQQFDVITMDPPWQITTGTITRGVNISYHQLDVNIIGEMPLRQVQSNGYIFMWVIASQFANGVLMLERWGYEVETYLNWVKVSKYGRYMPSHGYYMQHNKETVLVGRKGTPMPEMDKSKFESLIVACRESRQSQKPIDIYELIEQVFPGGMYLEIFARPHNLRNGWVSIGIELPT